MWNQASAILWAQWRTLRNYYPRSNKASLFFSGILTAGWYAVFVYLAFLAAFLLARPEEIDAFRKILPAALLLCFLYWQLIPVLMASLGSSLDMRKLLVYPIPTTELFTLEVLLRISTGIEMCLLMTGAGIGLLLNPKVPLWAPWSLVLFVIFNLCCSAGIRDLLVRLLARKRVREIVVFLLVLAAALPQILLFRGSEGRVRRLFAGEPSMFWPWTATARLALGEFSLAGIVVLLAWTAAAYVFGRWQFERGLQFDQAAAASQGSSNRQRAKRLDWLYRLPNLFFADPLAALIEKELRFLSRSPRFRLVFLMGFSFGLLIWAPMAFGRASSQHSMLGDNYLTFVTVYALLLLSDALFWNCFGFDRSAVQIYFTAPVKMTTVFLGKNIAASFLVLLEVSAISSVCALLRLPLGMLQIAESLSVACVLTLFLLAVGNLSSLYNPRSVNPAKSFRTAASGRTQALLMLAFPVSLIPVALAYLARYAFHTELAFFGVLLIAATLGGMVYFYATESAVKVASERKEQVIAALSRGEGPIES
jgi:ABC-2 type transport system permease protein